jgi:hypothetical protein
MLWFRLIGTIVLMLEKKQNEREIMMFKKLYQWTHLDYIVSGSISPNLVFDYVSDLELDIAKIKIPPLTFNFHYIFLWNWRGMFLLGPVEKKGRTNFW